MKMKFKVIYEQIITEKAMFVVEAESDDALENLFEKIEMLADYGLVNSLHNVFQMMDGSKDISVLEYRENYHTDIDAPEYYDHWEAHDENELEKENE